MEKFYIVTDKSPLRKEYLEYKAFDEMMWHFCKEFMKDVGIEANDYSRTEDAFAIVPTEKDIKTFAKMLSVETMQHGLRRFKKNSKVGKAWTTFLADKGIKFKHSPWVGLYFDSASGRARYRIFDIDGRVYCSYEAESSFKTPDGLQEIKASEFWKVIEDSNEGKGE